LVVFVLVVSTVRSFWVGFTKFLSVVRGFLLVVRGLVSRRLSKFIGGSFSVFSSLFLLLVGLNFMGLVPYVFSLTRHLAINLSISLPLWFGIILIGVCYDFGGFLAHLQPVGSPAALNPFLCLIELVSTLVRPITLSVRLTANLSTGHILIALLGSGFVGRGLLGCIFILILGLFYFMFEMGVCFIQAYIFTLLPVLYSDDHPVDSH